MVIPFQIDCKKARNKSCTFTSIQQTQASFASLLDFITN